MSLSKTKVSAPVGCVEVMDGEIKFPLKTPKIAEAVVSPLYTVKVSKVSSVSK